MELDALIRALAPSDVIGRRDVEILDLAHDTRALRAGALFFCVPGATRDGHDLAAEAVGGGAVALVVERPLEVAVPQLLVESVRASMAIAADELFGRPTENLTVAGVTGTNGKTTTTYLLRSILEADGRATGLVGTVEWLVGGATRDAPHTTPEAIDLQRLFREMLDAGDEAAAIEASSHGSHYRRLDRVRFGALAFTNLGQEHLDLHGDMEEYFRAKRRLFTGLTPPPAAINVGDPYGRRLAEELAGAHRAPLVTFGLRPEAEVRADGLEVGPKGSSFTAVGIDVETPLLGIFNVENVLAAVATARRLTLPRLVLLAEGALAAAVTTGMLVMLVATALWWAAMASSAPSFFGGAPGVASVWTPQLVGSLTLMVAALAAGTVGVVRIARAVRECPMQFRPQQHR